MIGVINPNSTQTLAAQLLEAGKADYEQAPDGSVPSESVPPSGHHRPTLSTAAIVGIVLGSVSVLVLCVAVVFYFVRKASNEPDQVPIAPMQQGPLYSDVGVYSPTAASLSGYMSPIIPASPPVYNFAPHM